MHKPTKQNARLDWVYDLEKLKQTSGNFACETIINR